MKSIFHLCRASGALLVLLAMGSGPRAAGADDVDRNLKLLKHANPYVRERAARALGKSGAKQAVPALVGALKDGTADVRRAALDALAQAGDASAFGAVKDLLADKSKPVRRSAVTAVGKLGGKEGVALLIAALKAEKGRDDRASRSRARDEPPWPGREPPTDRFETAVIDGLAAIGQPAIEPLKALLADKDETVKRVALRALHRLNWRPSTKAEQARSLVELGKWDELVELGAPAIRPLLEMLDKEQTSYRRTDAARQALRKVCDQNAVGPLTEALTDTRLSMDARRLARDLLTSLGPSVVKPLVAVLKQKDPAGSPLAAEALGRLGDARAIPALVVCLKSDPSDLRLAAAGALAALKWTPTSEAEKVQILVARRQWERLGQMGPAGLGPLLSALKTQEDGYERRAIVGALRSLGDKRAVGPLMEILTAPAPDPKVLATRAKAKGMDADRIRYHVAIQIRAAEDVGILAARVLGEFGDGRATKALTATLKSKSERLRAVAVTALGKTAGMQAFDVLAPMMKDPSPAVRLSAIQTLEALGGKRVGPPLIAALADDDRRVRVSAGHALGRLRDTRAVEPLLARLDEDDPRVRRETVRALAELKDGRAVEPILTMAEDGLIYAVQALGLLGDRRATQPLLAIAEDPKHPARVEAIGALGLLRDKRALGPCLKLMQAQEQRVRSAAVMALGELGDPRAFDPLMRAAKGDDLSLRYWAVMALGALGDGRAFSTIRAAFESEHFGLRSGAVQAFGRLGDKRAVPLLVPVILDPHVGRQAVKALKTLSWKPSTDAERIHFLIAQGNLDELRGHWPAAKDVLLTDCRSDQERLVAMAVQLLVSIGRDEGADALVQMLNKHGSQTLAKAMAASRDRKVRDNAMKWLRSRERRAPGPRSERK